MPPPDQPLECVPPPKAEPDPERHSRKCLICHHPDRAALESDYIHWVSPDYISSAYNLWDRQTIYRHARATGLNELRRQNLRCVIEPILEYTHYLRPTACDILNAARAYSRINDYGQWVDPPREVVISKRPYFQEGVNTALRKEIFDLMQDHGNHTQFSVFLCQLNRMELAALRSQLSQCIHSAQDQVLIVDLGPAQNDLDQAIEALGKPFVPTPKAFIV